MLIRLLVKNLLSFNNQVEFNLLPSRATRHAPHKYQLKDIEVLKMAALYGANGAGKSNLIFAAELLKDIVTRESIPYVEDSKFKLSNKNNELPIELGVEFFFNEVTYYYSVTINNQEIVDEYLAKVYPKQKVDELIFHRYIQENDLKIDFYDGFTDNKENVLLKSLIIKDLLSTDVSLLFLLNKLSSSKAFDEVKDVYRWFKYSLMIIYPDSSPSSLTGRYNDDKFVRDFASELVKSFNTGISSLKIEESDILEYLKNNVDSDNEYIDEIIKELKKNPDTIFQAREDEVVLMNDDGRLLAKKLVLQHLSDNDQNVDFEFHEESDGTQRLLEYIPAIADIVSSNVTYLIDEIERSLHPLIIKEILSKFSDNNATLGQLIFTTHESSLLDQNIFRTDEIWFAEKDKLGSTKLYSLSDFKEHNTIDIRKGYLNGRYGAIPFLGNLHDLNWNANAD